VIDSFAEDYIHDPLLDSILHGLKEVGFAEGPVDRKLVKYIKKTLHYRA